MKSKIVTKSKISILNYASVGDYLLAYIDARKTTIPGFSLRSWARHLGICSPSLLTMIARGDRQPSDEFIQSLAKKLNFNAKERNYAHHLAAHQRATDDASRGFHLEQLRRINPAETTAFLEDSMYAFMANWFHFPLFEVPLLSGFEMKADWISKKIGQSVTSKQIEESLKLFKRLKIFNQQKDGTLKRIADNIRTNSPIPSFVFRNLHKQVLQRAFHAIDHRPTNERHLSTSAIPISREKYSKAKEMIDTFVEELTAEMAPKETTRADDIYFLTIQFFSALENKSDQTTQKK
jgi:uncharacterized protein (TIGR02147 family)